MTATDKLFNESKPGYYIFEKPRVDVSCYTCNKKFDTCLLFNQFCCPKCKRKAINP